MNADAAGMILFDGSSVDCGHPDLREASAHLRKAVATGPAVVASSVVSFTVRLGREHLDINLEEGPRRYRIEVCLDGGGKTWGLFHRTDFVCGEVHSVGELEQLLAIFYEQPNALRAASFRAQVRSSPADDMSPGVIRLLGGFLLTLIPPMLIPTGILLIASSLLYGRPPAVTRPLWALVTGLTLHFALGRSRGNGWRELVVHCLQLAALGGGVLGLGVLLRCVNGETLNAVEWSLAGAGLLCVAVLAAFYRRRDARTP